MIELLLFQRRLEGLYLVDVDFKMVITEPCFFLWPGGNQPNQILLHKWRFVVVDNAVRCCCCERMDLPLESLWRKKCGLTQLDSTWLNLTQLGSTWLNLIRLDSPVLSVFVHFYSKQTSATTYLPNLVLLDKNVDWHWF